MGALLRQRFLIHILVYTGVFSFKKCPAYTFLPIIYGSFFLIIPLRLKICRFSPQTQFKV
jgi:hypothetical protein